ncbi:5-oxoprolinase subunit PxpB [Alicyclobacillaceae bacterium I2511]|nr:5-oxoprolinase subunit PxpB [Alicyclobacillaceae bacterium I2511]
MRRFPSVTLHPAGDQALLVEFSGEVSPLLSSRIQSLANWFAHFVGAGVYECIPGFKTLYIEYDPMVYTFSVLQTVVHQGLQEAQGIHAHASKVIFIPVCYNPELAPDLNDVAKLNELTVEDVIRLHSQPQYYVYFTGFLPNFPFLKGMPQEIATPRLARPRVLVPGGSVGIAGEQTGFYPVDSPGGWRIVGRIPVRMYDRRLEQPFFVQQGDWLQFFPVSRQEYEDLQALDATSPYEFRRNAL